MKREGIRGNIPSNHTIRKHFNINLTDTEDHGKYKSKFRKQHDYWPYEDMDEWNQNVTYNGSHIARVVLNYKNDIPVEPEYSRKPFYSIGESDKFEGFHSCLYYRKDRIIRESNKSLKKQKGCYKKNNNMIRDNIF